MCFVPDSGGTVALYQHRIIEGEVRVTGTLSIRMAFRNETIYSANILTTVTGFLGKKAPKN